VIVVALNDWELDYNGLVIGGYIDATGYDLTAVEGLEGFDVRSNDQVLPSFWGVQAGGDFVNARMMTLGVQAYPENTPEAAAFETAFVPSGQKDPTSLLPLTFKLPDQVEKRIMCRVRRRARMRHSGRPQDMAQWMLQLDAPDPRMYASEETVTLITPFAADTTALDLASGSGVNLAFNMALSSGADLAFDFTGTAASGSVSVSNDGNVDTFPSFAFVTTAAMATWHVINDTTGEQAAFAFALVPGYTIVADMAGVATGSTVPPVTINDQPNYPIWVSPRVPIRLVPGLNVLRFFVDSGTAAGSTCTLTHRDAWL
jgi:hypothetical protein